MNSNQLVQMALSAILRCNEKIDLFELVNILRGRRTSTIKQNGYDAIKTFGAGKMYSRQQWFYWLIQMIQLNIIYVDYDDNDYLKVLERGNQVLKGETDVTLKRLPLSSLTIKRNGTSFIIDIDIDIQNSVDWRKYSSDLNKAVYWNYIEERRLNIDEMIPLGVAGRERIKDKCIEIARIVYNLTVKDGVIIIPKKVDRDLFGKEVLPLSFPFEECLARLEYFIKTTGHYPQMNSLAEEVALRKWYREVGHGIIEITPEQKEIFARFKEQYPMSKYSIKGSK